VVGRVFAEDETFSGKSDTMNLLQRKHHPPIYLLSPIMLYSQTNSNIDRYPNLFIFIAGEMFYICSLGEFERHKSHLLLLLLTIIIIITCS